MYMLLFLFLTVQAVCAQTYKIGEKVEVRNDGVWYEGVYKMNLGEKYSNMKATPYSVEIKSKFLNGSVSVGEKDIRKYTGTLKPKFIDPPAASTVNTNTLENEVIAEINEMRTNPQQYANKLANLKSKYVKVDNRHWYLDLGKYGGEYVAGTDAERKKHEKALDEVIAELRSSKVLGRLSKNEKLRKSANIMASDAGKINGPKHLDSKGRTSQERAKMAGYTAGVEENLYTGTTAFKLVSGYLIDYKVPSRGHRKSLMRSFPTEIGVACHYFPKSDYIRNVIHIGYGEKNNASANNTSTNTTTVPATTSNTKPTVSTGISTSSNNVFNENNYYRLTNAWLGEGMSLDLYCKGEVCEPRMSETVNSTGQKWKIKNVGNNTYVLSTKGKGESKILECFSGENQDKPLVKNGSGYSGGAWMITSAGDGYYRITNSWLNGKSLDIINDGKNDKIQVAKTGQYSGQFWKITEIE